MQHAAAVGAGQQLVIDTVGGREVTIGAGAAELVADLFRAALNQDFNRAFELNATAIEAGLYGDTMAQRYAQADPSQRRDVLATLTDARGGVFLPTVVANLVIDIERNYGFVPQYCTQLPIANVAAADIPKVLGDIDFFAMIEGSELKARRTAFGKSTLTEKYFGVIVPWTLIAERKVGGVLIPIVLRKLGEGASRKKDQMLITADGTAAFHGRKGLIKHATDGNISYATSPTATAFGDLTVDDWTAMKFELPPSIREGGVYVTHPDAEQHILKLEDGDGRRYFPLGAGPTGQYRIAGRPVVFTEAFPYVDGASSPYAAYVNPNYVLYGNGQQMTTTRLTEATIKDTDDNTLIHLALTNSAALRCVFAMDVEFPEFDAAAVGRTKAAA